VPTKFFASSDRVPGAGKSYAGCTCCFVDGNSSSHDFGQNFGKDCSCAVVVSTMNLTKSMARCKQALQRQQSLKFYLCSAVNILFSFQTCF